MAGDTAVVRAALQHGLHITFWGVLLVSAGAFGISLLTPAVPLRRPVQAVETLPAEEVAI